MKPGRPKKPRNIQKEPSVRQFSPRGRVGRPGYAELAGDEYEALRLADFIGLSQKEASSSMGISQQTYSRVLKKARKGLAEGLELGKIIKIRTADNKQRTRKKGKRTLQKNQP